MRIEELSRNKRSLAIKQIYGDCKWSDDLNGNLYTDTHALILSEYEHNNIVQAQNGIVKLLHKIQNIISLKPELNEWLGIPENLISIISKEIDTLTTYGRFDWMVGTNGELNVLEFNAETPMGWKEACEYTINAHKLYYNKYKCVNYNIKDELEVSIRKTLSNLNITDGRVAIVGDLDDMEESDTFNMLAEVTNRVVSDVMLCSISDLKVLEGYEGIEDGIYAEKDDEYYPIDVLQTFYSIEWLSQDDGGEALIRFIKNGKVKLMNPTSTLQIHSKGIWALIWFLLLETELLKDDEELIRSVIPYSTFDVNDFVYFEIPKYVKKPLSHREGDGVTFEETSKVKDTDQEVTDSYSDEEIFVYQEYIDSETVYFPRECNGVIEYKYLTPTIGTYCINDEFCGYMSRLSEGVCSAYDSTFTPTFIEK